MHARAAIRLSSRWVASRSASRQVLLRLGQMAALERQHAEEVERAHLAVEVAPRAEPPQRLLRQGGAVGVLPEPGRRRGREQPRVGRQVRRRRLLPPIAVERVAEAAGADQLPELMGGVVGEGRDHGAVSRPGRTG